MKTNRTATLALLSAVTALAILSPSAFAASSTPMTLGMAGVITDAGNQHYVMSGGYLAYGEFNGEPLAPGAMSFSLNSQVTGLKTSGSASISLPGIAMNVVIKDEMPASVFPLDSQGGSCDPTVSSCNSEVPFMFTGIAVIHAAGQGQPTKLPIGIESAYWNPFGGPIVITSLESPTSPALLLVVTYNVATIDWVGVHLFGGVSGSLGSTPFSGYYATVTNSHEDLVGAVEQDSGQIAFVGMSIPSLNAKGGMSGTTTFSATGGIDCSADTTGIPGTCLLTGATSTGVFGMVGGHGVKIAGAFDTVWSVPSITTTSTGSAIVTQP